VKSILGLDDRDRSMKMHTLSATVDAIISGADLTSQQRAMVADGRSPRTGLSYREMLSTVCQEAQVGGRDLGKDLQKLLPELIKNPELLEKLHSVATAQQLLSVDVSKERRREFLAELITAAADPRLLNQGHTSMCTVTKQLSATSPANIISVSCDLVANGQARLQSGEVLYAGQGVNAEARERDLQTRLLPWAEKTAGHALDSSGESAIALHRIAARQPGPIMTTVLGSLMELNVNDVTQSQGQTWKQFGSSWRSMSGHESVCAAYDSKIQVDSSTGKPVWSHNASGDAVKVPGSREVSPVEYVDLTLERKSAGDAPPRGVLVNMRWADPEPEAGKQSMHSCHTLMVVGKQVDADGTWYVIENPVGSYIKSGHPPRWYGEGAELGNKDATWWKEGTNGLVRVRADVFKESLIHLMVDHVDRPYDAQTGDAPLHTLGSVNGNAKEGREIYTPYVVHLRHDTEIVKLDDRKSSSSAAEADAKIGLAQAAVDKAVDVRLRDAGTKARAVEQVVGTRRGFPKEDEETIIRAYDEQQERGVKKGGDANDNYASFFSSATPNQSQLPTPPPAPTVSPAERERQRATT
jgi:hypothetical protein